jgi:glyoxylase-like metal-dependent hydrolase (beta-lactamase superfamily II)
MLDVGTGLSILIQGADFAFLYDAGTNDRGERPARILDYLAAAIGPCKTPIHHVVLSHPHLDHASALEDVMRCYQVANFWDSGAINDTVFYRDLLAYVGTSAGLVYHTAAPRPDDGQLEFKKGPVVIPRAVDWRGFSEGDTVELGAGASFQLLHAEGKQHPDVNQNSIVVAVKLGGATVLLVGDAESGERADPSMPIGDVEEHLVHNFAKEIDVDILQVEDVEPERVPEGGEPEVRAGQRRPEGVRQGRAARRRGDRGAEGGRRDGGPYRRARRRVPGRPRRLRPLRVHDRAARRAMKHARFPLAPMTPRSGRRLLLTPMDPERFVGAVRG